ncbi:MAG: sulfite exporter TauE/SafE family protein [Desulfobulbaceae bacterium]|nr:sulfite exporter TauE/SafE family protein [Desulfobulbaceae bacterium]
MGHEQFLYYLGALGLGALHAFEPGHGKTLIASYMIGTRGRAVDGILLGFIVTFTHTFSVIILGLVAKLLSTSFTDQQLHGWLGLFSSLLIITVGIWMLRQRLSGDSAGHSHFHIFDKGHDHCHDHTHSHEAHEKLTNVHKNEVTDDHSHDHDHHTHQHSESRNTHSHEHGQEKNKHTHRHKAHTHDHDQNHSHKHQSTQNITNNKEVGRSKWDILFLGISGGLVPCPAAIAALLMAIAAGQIAKGFTMAILFSVGLGLVMMSIGVFLSYASNLTKKLDTSPKFTNAMGLISASVITILGTVTLYHAILSLTASA